MRGSEQIGGRTTGAAVCSRGAPSCHGTRVVWDQRKVCTLYGGTDRCDICTRSCRRRDRIVGQTIRPARDAAEPEERSIGEGRESGGGARWGKTTCQMGEPGNLLTPSVVGVNVPLAVLSALSLMPPAVRPPGWSRDLPPLRAVTLAGRVVRCEGACACSPGLPLAS